MATANTVITDALTDLVVQAAEAPIQPDEAQTAIRYLNRMMAEFDARGISLGFTTISNLGDDVTVPDGALGGVVANLAMKLAPQYEKAITTALFTSADEGLKAMRKLSVSILPTSFGDTLPRGSGNTGDSIRRNTFYSGDADNIANETGGYIATETDTEVS